MTKQLFKLFTFFFISYIAVSCSEQDLPDIPGNSDNAGQGIATIDQSEIKAEGGGFIIRIKTAGAWQAKSSETWCTLNQTSGNGNGSITGYLQANTGAERNVTITIEAGKESVTLKLKQLPNNGGNTGTSSQYAKRIEVPELQTKGNNLFITNKTQYNGKETITYSLEYNCNMKMANWVAFTFDNTTCLQIVKRPSNDPWSDDMNIPAPYQTHASDYNFNKNQMARGHLCASSDRLYSKEANEQTFIMSNVNPQIQNKFNAGIWAKLEERVQKWGQVSSSNDTLYVVKGGSFTDYNNIKFIDYQIPIPQYFFMAILSLKEGKYHAIGFWLEHKEYSNSDFKSYALSIDELEAKTGLNFFCNLSKNPSDPANKEEVVEANFNPSDWSW